MTREVILKQVRDIFSDILDNEKLVLTEQTQATDINDWDSLNHIQLVVAVEKHFNLRFTSTEIQTWKDVGEMIDSIQKKIINI